LSENDRILLDEHFGRFKKLHPDIADDAHQFEFFSATQILKPLFELDDDEVLDGLTRTESGSGGNDGGIDAAYGFVNQTLIQEDTSPASFGADSVMQFVVIQSKRTAGYDEAAMLALAKAMRDLFDLGTDYRGLKSRYNEVVRERFNRYRTFIRKVSPKRLVFNVFYASRGDVPAKNVADLAEDVRHSLVDHFSDASIEFSFVNAARLLTLIRQSPSEVVHLSFSDLAYSPDRSGLILFVKLTDFYKMISTEDGGMKMKLFEANVRDYQGSNVVNEAIAATLEEVDGEDFWAVNNGVTIVADEADARGTEVRMTDPRVVNGLQTSKEIHLHFSSENAKSTDERLLVVRVVVPKTPRGRDRIIFSTNSQTKIPPANLRATDEFQVQIEDYLLRYGYYYDRRKNFYKNQGKAPDRIIPVLFMAQAVSSIRRKEPRIARAFPSRIMTDNEIYAKVFDRHVSLEEYLSCAVILKQSQKAIAASDLEQKIRNNVRFHVALCYASLVLKRRSVGGHLRFSYFEHLNETVMKKAIAEVSKTFTRLSRANANRTEDWIGKSPAFQEAVIATISRLVAPSPGRRTATGRLAGRRT
jgi:hypothetical protein